MNYLQARQAVVDELHRQNKRVSSYHPNEIRRAAYEYLGAITDMAISNRQHKRIEWVADIIRRSGIATKIQREAIIQRIIDAANEQSETKQSIPHRNITGS